MTSFEFTKETPRENTWLVYFNGIEVPVTSIDIRMGVWAIPSADIAMPPDKELYRLGAEDRVQVSAFYLDNYHTEVMGKKPDFRLFYEGDIVGWQFTNTPAGRILRFRSTNYLDILDSLYTFFMTSLDSMAIGTMQGKVDQNQVETSMFAPIFPAALLYMGIDPSQGKRIRRPFDLLENAVRACIGTDAHEKYASVAAVNFYARYMHKTMFHQRFVPSPMLEIDHMRVENNNDPDGIFPMLRYAQFQDALNTLQKHMNDIANNSIWGIVRDTFMRLYYEIAAITTAPIAQVNVGKGGVDGEIVGPPKFNGNQPAEPLQPNRILNYITKPDWKFGVPPTCNVIFPSMIKQFAYEEDYSAQATRLYLSDYNIPEMLNTPNSAIKRFANVPVGYPVRAQEELEKRASPVKGQGDSNVSGKNFLIWPEEFYRGPHVIQEDTPQWFMFLLQGSLTPVRYEQIKPKVEDTDMAKEVYGWPVPPEDGKKKEGAKDSAEEQLDSVFKDRDATGRTQEERDCVAVKFTWLKRLYARYEYLRQRTSCRSGAVEMIFNPYILPGFPVVVFDQLGTGNHCIGYAQEVSFSLNQGHSGTTVTLTHMQTLDEYMQGILESRTGENPEARTYTVLANPPNPVPDVRIVTQMFDPANQYFQQLLHQNRPYANPLKTAAFDFTKAIELVLPSKETVSVSYVLDPSSNHTALSQYVRIQPTEAYRKMFENASNAMALISRPICTLEEYIKFFGERGCTVNSIDPNNAHQGKGAVYYEKILKVLQGPGDAPKFNADNTLVEPVKEETRANWEKHLQNYRKKVIFQLHPQEE